MGLKIKVVSSIPPDPKWGALAAYTCETQRRFCERHGYSYHLDVSDVWDRRRSPKRGDNPEGFGPIKYFIKFRLFQHFLDPDQCREEWDAVVWLDSDLLITNPEIPLEKWLNGRAGTDEEDPQLGDILLTRDVNGLHATVIMIRRTALTLGFVWANANAGMTYWMEDDWSDQMSMRMFLGTPPYRDLVWYHSVKSLCAMPPDTYPIPKRARRIYEWEPGDFALHLSAMNTERRVEIAKDYCERLELLA